jgi:hypothetical protein
VRVRLAAQAVRMVCMYNLWVDGRRVLLQWDGEDVSCGAVLVSEDVQATRSTHRCVSKIGPNGRYSPDGAFPCKERNALPPKHHVDTSAADVHPKHQNLSHRSVLMTSSSLNCPNNYRV